MNLSLKLIFSFVLVFFIVKNIKAQNRDSIENELRLSFKPTLVATYKNPINNYLQFDPKNLPLFCKIEYKLDKATQLLVRFRLGSLDYVNALEGKTK